MSRASDLMTDVRQPGLDPLGAESPGERRVHLAVSRQRAVLCTVPRRGILWDSTWSQDFVEIQCHHDQMRGTTDPRVAGIGDLPEARRALTSRAVQYIPKSAKRLTRKLRPT